MRETDIKVTGTVILISTAMVTIVLMVYAARPWGDNYAYKGISDYLILFGFILWAISPYGFVLFLLHRYRHIRVSLIAALVGTVIITTCGIAIYIDTVFIHVDAQGALIFVLFPAYQWIGGALIAIVCKGLQQRTPSSGKQ